MLSPDDPDARFLVTAIVRDIAAGTGLTSIARIGENERGPFAVNIAYLHDPDLDYGRFLADITDDERRDPLSLPVSACALILPDRDIAYIKHGTAPMTTLTVGPNPKDDPDTHRTVDTGLTAFMELLTDTQPADRPAGRPFPSAAPGRVPNTSPHHRPINGWTPPQPGRDSRSPHR